MSLFSSFCSSLSLISRDGYLVGLEDSGVVAHELGDEQVGEEVDKGVDWTSPKLVTHGVGEEEHCVVVVEEID